MALPVVVLGGGDRPMWVTVPVLLVTVVTAGWLTAALRRGVEIDEHGLRLHTGRRRPRRLGWGDVDRLRFDDPAAVHDVTVDQPTLTAVTRSGREVTVAQSRAADDLADLLEAVHELGLVPVHVSVASPRDPRAGPSS